jgi:hypothetical protein
MSRSADAIAPTEASLDETHCAVPNNRQVTCQLAAAGMYVVRSRVKRRPNH